MRQLVTTEPVAVTLPPARQVAISADGRVLAALGDDAVHLADLELGRHTFTLPAPGAVCLALSASNVVVALGKRLRMWNVLAGREVATARLRAEARWLASSWDGGRFAALDVDGRVRVFRAAGLKREAEHAEVAALCFDVNELRLERGRTVDEIAVADRLWWRTAEGVGTGDALVHPGATAMTVWRGQLEVASGPRAIAVHPLGRHLAVATDDGVYLRER